MNRYLAYAVGPELLWVLFLMLTSLLVARNRPPSVAGNQQLELIGLGFIALLVGAAIAVFCFLVRSWRA